MLSAIWQLLCCIARALKPVDSTIYEADVGLGLRPKTVTLYRIQAQKFLEWVDTHRVEITYNQELDAALILYARQGQISRGNYERLVSAITLIHPPARHGLPFTRQKLVSWRRAQPPRHALPIPWTAAVAVALHWAMAGLRREARLACGC